MRFNFISTDQKNWYSSYSFEFINSIFVCWDTFTT